MGLATRRQRVGQNAAAMMLALGVTTCLWSSPARAQQLGVGGTLGGAAAVANQQARELGVGAVGAGALQLQLNRSFAAQVGGLALGLSSGRAPNDPSLAENPGARLLAATVGLHLRPFAGDGNPGPWAEVNGGAGVTGNVARGMIFTQIGYDFWLDRFGIGPAAGFLYVPQPDGALRPDDALVATVGLHGVFWPLPKAITPGPKDSDGDGLLDPQDGCPRKAEDRDGFEDEDGCPDPDNDKDGVLDGGDHCPMVPEDIDKFEDNDGCPDPDNDKDGIADKADKCPDKPEDRDGFEDTDGCPEPDNDKDGIPDRADLCPDEPETFNGYADKDGCPDAEDIRVVGDEIMLDTRAFFGFNSRSLTVRYWPVVQRLARLLNKHPEYIRISIEGHADETGGDDYNKKLSVDRAKEVRRHLIRYGVNPNRLVVVGHGSSKPWVSGSNHRAWKKNRRVEFRIQRQRKVKAGKGPVKAPENGAGKKP